MRNVLFGLLSILTAVFGLTASASALHVSAGIKSSMPTADQPIQIGHRRHGGFSINLGYGGFGYGYGRPYRYYGGYYPTYGSYYSGYYPSYRSRYYQADDDYYDEPVYNYRRSYRIRKHWDGGRDYRRSSHHRHHRRHH